MEIKEATPADLPVLAKTIRIFHDEILDYGKYLTFDEILFQPNFLQIMENEYGFCRLLWDDDVLAGIIFGHLSPNFYDPRQLKGICDGIGILPKYQRSHWANKLLKIFEEWAAEKGAHVLFGGGNSKKFENMMKRMGYQKIETSYVKKVDRSTDDIKTGGK